MCYISHFRENSLCGIIVGQNFAVRNRFTEMSVVERRVSKEFSTFARKANYHIRKVLFKIKLQIIAEAMVRNNFVKFRRI
jgi:hypothetical protein